MMNSDPTADILLANLDWARHLARSLVRDEARADDLVQDAWLRSRSAASPDGALDGPGSRRWLGRVLRNLARDARQSVTRRAHREAQAARPEGVSIDDNLRERVGRQEVLGRWVLELDEPYRRTMLLRWFEGNAAADIATAEEVSPATVRTRLRRGAALLRDRAERESSGDGRAWLAGVAGIPLASTPSALPPSAALTAGFFAMNAKVIIALIAALLLGAAWTLWPSGEPSPGAAVDLATRSVGSIGAAGPTGEEGPLEMGVRAGEGRKALAAAAGEPGAPRPEAPTTAERDLLIRVIGADGEPAIGEPVVVVHGRTGNETEWLSATSEGPDGIARFVDYLGQREHERQYVGAPKFVGLDVIGFKPPRVGLPSSGLPDVAPELRVPAHAELVVRLVDGSGAAFPLTEYVMVTPLGPGADPNRSVERGDRASRYLRQQSEARFPRVTPGNRLWLQVMPAGVLANVEQVVPPLRAGERRTVELVMGAKDAHVVGRVVHPDGRPVAISSFDVAFEPSGTAVVYTVGADGSFALPLDRLSVEEGSFGGQIEAQLRATGAPGGPVQTLTGTFEAVVPRKGDAYDVGAVVLLSAPTIAEGRVIDSTGAPVKRAAIALYDKINQRDDPEDFTWSFAGVSYVYTDDEGRFDLKGKVEPGEYALRVLFVDWMDRGALRFQAGARGIELIVDRKRVIVGRLVFPDGVDPTRLQVRAREEGAPRERAMYSSWTTGVDAEGGFTLRDLRPEAVTISVHLPDLEDPIAQMPNALPRLEEEGAAPELDPWDLSAALTRLRFDVNLADGKPIQKGFIALGSRVLKHNAGSVDAIVPTHWGDELQVFALGHVPARVAMARDLRRVDLMRGPRVMVSLNTPLPEPPEGVTIELQLVPYEPTWALPPGGAYSQFRLASRLGSESIRCQPGERSWELHGAGPGRYRPRWTLIAPRGRPIDGARTSSFVNATGRYEIVLDVAGGATAYAADYDREDWDEALRGLTEER